jgi:hypothetical protein
MGHGRARNGVVAVAEKPATPMSPLLAEQPPLILIATLNADTRVALARLVTRHAMTALACFDGAAALAACQIYRHGLVGVIVAADLPSLSGEELAVALAVEHPALASCVLAEGHLDVDESERVAAWLEQLALSLASAADAAPYAAMALG